MNLTKHVLYHARDYRYPRSIDFLANRKTAKSVRFKNYNGNRAKCVSIYFFHLIEYPLIFSKLYFRIVDPELAVTMLHKTPARPMNYPGGNPGGGRSNFPPYPSQHEQQRPPPQGPPMGFGGGGGPLQRDPRDDPRERRDPRDRRDPRGGGGGGGMNQPRDPRASRAGGSNPPPPSGGGGMNPELPPHLQGVDPERAALIMEVLKLSDQQIMALPADQRQSIMELKKQINNVP